MPTVPTLRDESPSTEEDYSLSGGHDPSTIRDYATTITLLDSMRDAIFILDESGEIQYANRGALTLLKTDLSSIIGLLIDELIRDPESESESAAGSEDNASAPNQRILEKLNQGVFGNIEAVLTCSQTKIPVSVTFSMVNDPAENPQYIVVTARDESHRVTLENERLQQQTLSISYDRLRTLGELSVGLVHELTQPLLALKLQVEMLQEKIEDSDQTRSIGHIMELADRMSGIIHNMRSFASQAESQMLAMINVNENVQQALNLLSYELTKRSVDVQIKAGSELPYIIGNPLLVQQVFVNILTNSRDAFDHLQQQNKSPDLKHITIETRANGQKWIEAVFEDNAGGINPEIQDRIYEPFFTTRDPGKNSGVGLAITRNIITSMGGDLRLKVMEGIGSRFTVRIPVAQEEERTQLRNLIEMLNEKS